MEYAMANQIRIFADRSSATRDINDMLCQNVLTISITDTFISLLQQAEKVVRGAIVPCVEGDSTIRNEVLLC